MKLDYHYGKQAFQYAMVEIPLLMFIDDAFASIDKEPKASSINISSGISTIAYWKACFS